MKTMLGFSTQKPWVRALLCAACLYHIAAMVSANLPFTTAFGSELRRPFTYYIGYAGLWQNWVMFHTIPHFRAVRPLLVARYSGGSQSEHGAMLPDLTPYKHRTRLGSLFFRYTWPTNDILPYGRAYLQRACKEVGRMTGKKPSTMTLRLDSLRLQSLADARKTGKPGKGASDFSTMNVPCD
jgi:hypothetical protein